MKNIYLLAGPSGSGKSSVARELTKRYDMREVWSYTERPPRYDGEPGHVFVTPEQFDAAGKMCAFTLYNGYRYGVPESVIEETTSTSLTPLASDICRSGIREVRAWSSSPSTLLWRNEQNECLNVEMRQPRSRNACKSMQRSSIICISWQMRGSATTAWKRRSRLYVLTSWQKRASCERRDEDGQAVSFYYRGSKPHSASVDRPFTSC